MLVHNTYIQLIDVVQINHQLTCFIKLVCESRNPNNSKQAAVAC